MNDFFISYNGADRAWAEWIAWQLEEAGYTTVLQAWDFRPGCNFVPEMQKASSESEHTIAVLSPSYLEALFTQSEWAAALAKDPTGAKRSLIPVRVTECDGEGLLAAIVYIDLVGSGDDETAKEALLAGIARERAKPSARPEFPGSAERSVAVRPRFPGALPSIWNVPHRRNPNFTGRGALLESLRSALTSGLPAARTQAISGLGGVGKSQLALEYAYRYASEYECVWWVPSEEVAALASELAALAHALELPEREAADQGAIVDAVRRWLDGHGGWLLVFDNARGADSAREYLPQGETGHILITSRDPSWGGVASALPVAVWHRPESVEFLKRRTGQEDGKAADELAAALGDLPLALEQAGAYIEETGTTL